MSESGPETVAQRHHAGSSLMPNGHAMSEGYGVSGSSPGAEAQPNHAGLPLSPGGHSREPGPGTTTRTACSYCGVGCGIEVTTGTGATRAPVIAKVAGGKQQTANPGRQWTKGAPPIEQNPAPGPMTTPNPPP
ncbi:hypothetical protein, partial [Nocardia carnea]|uniref:hypothetical protein n=1 Tax=Nocardia carnea TaxID=37328 RepID=UPI00245635EF